MTAPEVDALLAAVKAALAKLVVELTPRGPDVTFLEQDQFVHLGDALVSVRAAEHVRVSMQSWPADETTADGAAE